MKREIKFRAWNGVLHEYRTIDMNSGKQNLGMGFESTEGIGSNTTTIYHSFGDVIEQFTGLHDKNGREIYEGDIVKVFDDDGDSFVSEISWQKDYPAFDLVRWPNHYYDSNALSAIVSGCTKQTMEVVGNVYENPELLEAEK